MGTVHTAALRDASDERGLEVPNPQPLAAAVARHGPRRAVAPVRPGASRLSGGTMKQKIVMSALIGASLFGCGVEEHYDE
ncbi:MAG: hypothetical protein SangKO_057950 [Sandaracinaceae bacterium]